MSEKETLLGEILANPDDDAARMVYADWLAERGDPLGEFIHLQCESCHCEKQSQRRKLRQRERELLADQRILEVQQEITSIARKPVFRRGFIEQVTISIRDFLKYGARLFQLTPLRQVVLTAGASRIERLAQCKLLSRLSGVTLSNSPFGDVSARTLALSPHIQNLTYLRIHHCDVGPEGAESLADSLPRLAVLDLTNNLLTSPGVAFLARSPQLANLQKLSLSNNELTSPAARAAAHLARWNKLEFLDLSGNWFLHAEAAEYLASADSLSQLKTLDLSGCRIGPDGARAIAESNGLGQLSTLGLNGNDIGDEGVMALAASPRLKRLQDLRLSFNGISFNGVDALLSSPHRSQKMRLYLGQANVSRKEIRQVERLYGRSYGLKARPGY